MRSFLLMMAMLLCISFAIAQSNTPVMKANYQLAARFSPRKLDKMIFNTSVDPHWLKKSERFWYEYETPDGKKMVHR